MGSHLSVQHKAAWILGELSTSLGLAFLSGNCARDIPLLPSHSSCSSLQTGAHSLLAVFTRTKWIGLFEKLGDDGIFKTGSMLYSPKF